MKRRLEQYVVMTCSAALLLLCSGCSYLTDFVVVNASGQAVEIRYTIKKPLNPLSPTRIPVSPGVKQTSQLQQQVAWRELTTSEYKFDVEARTVTVSLMPGQALRVAHYNLADGSSSDTERATLFFVEGLEVTGGNGEILLKGEQVYKSFLAESKTVYALRYR